MCVGLNYFSILTTGYKDVNWTNCLGVLTAGCKVVHWTELPRCFDCRDQISVFVGQVIFMSNLFGKQFIKFFFFFAKALRAT